MLRSSYHYAHVHTCFFTNADDEDSQVARAVFFRHRRCCSPRGQHTLTHSRNAHTFSFCTRAITRSPASFLPSETFFLLLGFGFSCLKPRQQRRRRAGLASSLPVTVLRLLPLPLLQSFLFTFIYHPRETIKPLRVLGSRQRGHIGIITHAREENQPPRSLSPSSFTRAPHTHAREKREPGGGVLLLLAVRLSVCLFFLARSLALSAFFLPGERGRSYDSRREHVARRACSLAGEQQPGEHLGDADDGVEDDERP